jgi:peptide/nickel transport system ATP-binding protein
MSEVVRVRDLAIATAGGREIVSSVSFAVGRGETLALVGESGCGKTSTALALLGHARAGTRIDAGTVALDAAGVGAEDILALPERRRRALRGRTVAYVPQDPTTALDPRQRVGRQVGDVLRAHGGERAREEVEARVVEMLDAVGLPSERAFRRRYPFELSGGQQQRLTIAMALVAAPAVVVLDEPTTGLDVVTQARILDLLRRIARTSEVAFVYVTHDLAAVDGLADRVAVMYAGRIVELGATGELFRRPSHPYTALLLESMPRLSYRHELKGIAGTAPAPGMRPEACRFAPRCPLAIDVCRTVEPPPEEIAPGHVVRCHRAAEAASVVQHRRLAVAATRAPAVPLLRVEELHASYRSHGEVNHVCRGISLDVAPGACVALVGESGSGKSTLGRCIVGLHRPDAGRILLDGEPLAAHASERTPAQCERIQFVFQNPDRSLNPGRTVRQILARPLQRFGHVEGERLGAAIEELLERVRLPHAAAARFPRELSGGEKQRVAIARALAGSPRLLVCDEVTSALDVSIQAAIVSLLAELRRDGLALLFITHDLALVNSIADEVAVLERGVICERGPAVEVLERPQHAYTRTLRAAAPEVRSDLADGRQPVA